MPYRAIIRPITGVHIIFTDLMGGSNVFSTPINGIASTGREIQDLIDSAVDAELKRSGYIDFTRAEKRDSLKKFRNERGES